VRCTLQFDTSTTTIADAYGAILAHKDRILSDSKVTLTCKKGHYANHRELTCSYGEFKETGSANIPECKLGIQLFTPFIVLITVTFECQQCSLCNPLTMLTPEETIGLSSAHRSDLLSLGPLKTWIL